MAFLGISKMRTFDSNEGLPASQSEMKEPKVTRVNNILQEFLTPSLAKVTHELGR